MRTNGVLTWLLGDHLGSTTITANADGTLGSEQKYTAWGQTRSGSVTTDRQYTGQISESYINLYWYGSRWYDSKLGRFIQPDTYIPDKGNPQGLDRYAYVANNPISRIDTGGHCWGIASFIRGLPTYRTTCENLDMALTIIQSDETTAGQKAGAVAYIGAEDLAHSALVVGSVACLSNVAVCATGARTALAIGGATAEEIGKDGDWTNEWNAATKIGNTVMESVSNLGKIESQLVTKADILGIKPSGNMGDLSNPIVQKGLSIINDITANAERI